MREIPEHIAQTDVGIGFPVTTMRGPEQPILFALRLTTGRQVLAIVEEAEESHIDMRKWVVAETGEYLPPREVQSWQEV